MSDILRIQEQKYVFIGKESQLEGNFQFHGTTKLAGHLSGEVIIKDESHLTIEPSGKVKGKVFCHNIDIYGEMEGELKATGKVSVHPFAKLSGLVHATAFSFDANANINILGHAKN